MNAFQIFAQTVIRPIRSCKKFFQVSIHPFIDGNGRTARLLMNLILMQGGFPPIIIPVDARADYYDTLTAANRGDLRPFIRFIARQTDLTLQVRLV